jgi:hypothetical protein
VLKRTAPANASQDPSVPVEKAVRKRILLFTFQNKLLYLILNIII